MQDFYDRVHAPKWSPIICFSKFMTVPLNIDSVKQGILLVWVFFGMNTTGGEFFNVF